jgi:hypothetical protein
MTQKIFEVQNVWESKKNNLLENIDRTINEGRDVDTEVLEIMKELLQTVKIKVNMKDYFGNNKGD